MHPNNAARKRWIAPHTTSSEESLTEIHAFSEVSSLDPMERIAMQGQMLRDAKRRLRDPTTPRLLRWSARFMLGLVVSAFVVPSILALVLLVVAVVR